MRLGKKLFEPPGAADEAAEAAASHPRPALLFADSSPSPAGSGSFGRPMGPSKRSRRR